MKLTVFEAKYGPITFDIYWQACKARALLRDSKGDPTVNACNRSLQNQERFQQEVLSWVSLAPVFDDFYQAHVEYEKLYGEQKIELRDKRQALLLTNGDVLEKEAAGGLRKKGTAMAVKVKVRRSTKLVGNDRRTSNNRKKPYRMITMDGDGEANHRRLEEKSRVETEPMIHPGQVDLLEELPEEMTFSRPYEGARYELDECTDFSPEQMVPSGVKDPFGRFAGRKVRSWFDSTNPKERHKMTESEGVVVKYNKQKATFRIRYQGFDRKMDVEDVDMSTLEDILIMGPKYGDQRAEWAKLGMSAEGRQFMRRLLKSLGKKLYTTMCHSIMGLRGWNWGERNVMPQSKISQ